MLENARQFWVINEKAKGVIVTLPPTEIGLIKSRSYKAKEISNPR